MTHRVRLSHALGSWPFDRQAPGGSGVWNDWVFTGGGDRAPDYWVVYDDLFEAETARVAREHTVLVTQEPEAMRAYHPRFVAQFGLVLTTQPRIQGSNVLHGPTGNLWHVGLFRPGGGDGRRPDPPDSHVGKPLMGYDEFRIATFDKTGDLSVVCSSKTTVGGHLTRLALVERLKEHFGERLDWFGRGVRPIEDKLDAVAPYRFHVVLENSVEPDYWTEKLADAYLARAFPFYWGCPNVEDYFEPDAFVRIDPYDVDATIATIEKTLEEGLTPARLAALERAREAVLDRYNLFALIASSLAQCQSPGRRRRVRIRPQYDFLRGPWWRRAEWATRRAVRRVVDRLP